MEDQSANRIKGNLLEAPLGQECGHYSKIMALEVEKGRKLREKREKVKKRKLTRTGGSPR